LAILVILVLGVLWAAVLLPPILRSRSQSGAPSGGIGDFVGRLRDGLGGHRGSDPALPPLVPIMGPVGGAPMGPVGGPMGPVGGPATPMGPVRVPGGMSPAQRRRRDVLVGLLAAAGLTFLMAFVAGSMIFWVLQLLADALLGGYIYLLLQLKARNQVAAPMAPGYPAVANGYPVATNGYSAAGNVAQLSAHRPRPAVIASHVDAPQEATVLALRRTASW
jgi:hypothetical protein